GNFGAGFAGAGFAQAFSPLSGRASTNAGRVVSSALVGGTASVLSGGKFANGAVTAAMSYAMGQMAPGGGGQSSGPSEEPGKATLKVGQSRLMTEGEIAMAQDVFGGDVDYSKVKVFNRKFRFFQQRGVAMAPNGNIYFHPADYMDDFSTSTMGNRAWFMHEMTHVWQHQRGINVYSAALDRRYDYRPLALGKAFQSYGLEQQADIVQDYFLMRNGYQPQWRGHAIGEYQAILPFGRSP
ncbi:hypothetical protein, partial [Aestuariivirga sp.]|uniref:hypothetical protein n=1 Tax=Aestuariivirga sp. TaxID=2650926 RepID=UPI0039190F65